MASPGPSTDSVTAIDYLNSQLQLESEAREALPYSFDKCTRPLGVLRQQLYACKTCTPAVPTPTPGFGATSTTGAAALCYSCSISCHGDHELVEIFEKRGFRCDCGTGRIPGVGCQIRKESGVQVEEEQQQPTRYGQNFWGRFCTCEALYEPEKEKGVMWQCLLGDICQEDWFHDTCLVGRGPPGYVLGREEELHDGTNDTEEQGEEDEDDKRLRDLGFPPDDQFEHMICWRCIEANPWLKRLAAYPGFFVLERKEAAADIATVAVGGSPPTAIGETPADKNTVEATQTTTEATGTAQPEGAAPPEETAQPPQGQKRKASSDSLDSGAASPTKRVRPDLNDSTEATPTTATEPTTTTACTLPPSPALPKTFTLLLPSSFRTLLCHCPDCFPHLRPFPQLREAEESHEPPVSPPASIYDESERALNSMDRVQAIEGVLAYNKLKERVKAFLEPFAKSGRAVGEEDVKGYFEGLREREREGGN